ncbi:MAG: hypothetical protein ACOX6T_11480 [Myxococcales bacterium]|jgi:hypothetical protein
MAISACGGGIESKEDAAKALQRLAFATKSASGDKASPGGALSGSLTMTVDGKEGSATVTYSFDLKTGLFSADVTYDDFSADGVNTFDGNMSTTMAFKMDLENPLAGMSLDLTMKGEVEMTGEYNADIEVDVVFSMKVSDLENLEGASVEATIDGRVVADGEEYVFDNESLMIETAKP